MADIFALQAAFMDWVKANNVTLTIDRTGANEDFTDSQIAEGEIFLSREWHDFLARVNGPKIAL